MGSPGGREPGHPRTVFELCRTLSNLYLAEMILGSISDFFGDFRIFFVLAVLGPEIGPDRPDLPRYFVLDQNLPLASHARPFRGRNVQKPVGPGLCASGVLDVSVQFRLRPRQLFCALKFCLSKCLLLATDAADVTARC